MSGRFNFLEIITPDNSLQATVHYSGFVADSKYIINEAKSCFADGVHKATERAFKGVHKILYSPMKSSYNDCCYLAASGVHTHSKARGMGYEQIYIYQKKGLQKKDRYLDEIFGTILVNEGDALAVYFKELNGEDVCSAYRMVPRINRFDAEDPDYYNVAKAIIALADKKKLIVRLRQVKRSICGEALESAAKEFLLKLYSMIPTGLRTEYGFCAFGSEDFVDKDGNFDILVFPSDKDVKIELPPMVNTEVINLDCDDTIFVPEYLVKWFRLDNDIRLAESSKIISMSIRGALNEIAESMTDQREWWQKEESSGTIESLYELCEKHSQTPSLSTEGSNTEFIEQVDRYFKPRTDEGGFENYVWELLSAEESEEKTNCINYCRRMFAKSTNPSLNKRFEVLERYFNEHTAKKAKESELENTRTKLNTINENYKKVCEENAEMSNATNELIERIKEYQRTLESRQTEYITAENKNSEELRKLSSDIVQLRNELFDITKNYPQRESIQASSESPDRNNEKNNSDHNESSKVESEAKKKQPLILKRLKKNIAAVIAACALAILAVLIVLMSLSFSMLNKRLDEINTPAKTENTALPTVTVTEKPEPTDYTVDIPELTDKPSETDIPESTDAPVNESDLSVVWEKLSAQFSSANLYMKIDDDYINKMRGTDDSGTGKLLNDMIAVVAENIEADANTASYNTQVDKGRISNDLCDSFDQLLIPGVEDSVMLFFKVVNGSEPSQIVILNMDALQKKGLVDAASVIANYSTKKTQIEGCMVCFFAKSQCYELLDAFDKVMEAPETALDPKN